MFIERKSNHTKGINHGASVISALSKKRENRLRARLFAVRERARPAPVFPAPSC